MTRDLLDFYTNASLLELGLEADRMREARHPHNTVTYIVDRNINYTNVCVADCGFCASTGVPSTPKATRCRSNRSGRKSRKRRRWAAYRS